MQFYDYNGFISSLIVNFLFLIKPNHKKLNYRDFKENEFISFFQNVKYDIENKLINRLNSCIPN